MREALSGWHWLATQGCGLVTGAHQKVRGNRSVDWHVMSGSSMTSKLSNEYQKLWRSFFDAANAESLSADARPSTGADVKPDGEHIVVNALVVLKGWRYK